MRINTIETRIFDQDCVLSVMEFLKSDGKTWKLVFDSWRQLKMSMRDYKAREPNFPEGLSEAAFCIWSGGASAKLLKAKKLSNTSFDTVNTNTKRAEQIKACSVSEDLTSFGPKSKWDDLYFLDFYNEGKVDGIFDIYHIQNELIYNNMVNKLQSLKDQQGDKRRPRFSIKKNIIEKHNIKPIASKVKLW